MNGAADPLQAAAHLAAALVARVQDVLPRLRDVERGVAEAWRDPGGRAWAERSSLVRRALERDLDAALAAERAARNLLDALVPGRDTPVGAASVGTEPGRDVTGPAAGGGRGSALRVDRDRGARLGGTDADRTDDERGMRLGTLDG